jgi:hypothetical protein
MSVRDGMRSLLSERRSLRASLLGVIVLGLALLAVWPHGTLDTAIRTGQASDTFTVVSICFLLVLLYLGARFGSEDLSTDTGPRLHEYAALTPVSLVSLVFSRAATGMTHTVVLLLLGTPILIASMSVGGAGFAQVGAALALVGGASLAARMWGLLALALAGSHRALRGAILFVGIAGGAAATSFFAPIVSPFRVLATLSHGTDTAWLPCAGAGLGAALAFAAGALAVLAEGRARSRRRAAGVS